MLSSEKMIASLDQQDLAHAEKYFQKALKEDDAETLIALGEYLESIGFLPHAKRLYLQLADDYLNLILTWHKSLLKMMLWKKLFSTWTKFQKTVPIICQLF